MSRYRAPDIRCTEYRHSWLVSWLAEGARGHRVIRSAIADLERCRAIDRTYNRVDADLLAALGDLRRAIGEPISS